MRHQLCSSGLSSTRSTLFTPSVVLVHLDHGPALINTSVKRNPRTMGRRGAQSQVVYGPKPRGRPDHPEELSTAPASCCLGLGPTQTVPTPPTLRPSPTTCPLVLFGAPPILAPFRVRLPANRPETLTVASVVLIVVSSTGGSDSRSLRWVRHSQARHLGPLGDKILPTNPVA